MKATAASSSDSLCCAACEMVLTFESVDLKTLVNV